MKVVATLTVAAVSVALCVSAATAAPTHRDSTQTRSFCATAKGISKYLASTLALTNGTAEATPANLKLAYTTIVRSESSLNATAPKPLRPSLVQAFSFVNLAKSDLEKVNWQAAKLTPYLPALLAKYNATEKQIKVVTTYLDGTCHLDI